MEPNIGQIADAAIAALHENAKRAERLGMRMLASSERDELMWIVEAMRNAEDKARARIAEIAREG